MSRFILSAPVSRGNSRADRAREDVEAVAIVRAVMGLVEEPPPFRLDCERKPESVMALPARCWRWWGGLLSPLMLLLLLLAARDFSSSARNLLSCSSLAMISSISMLSEGFSISTGSMREEWPLAPPIPLPP